MGMQENLEQSSEVRCAHQGPKKVKIAQAGVTSPAQLNSMEYYDVYKLGLVGEDGRYFTRFAMTNKEYERK